jgi:protein involved in polysaccharide export with SLBB domain/Zn-dependent protease with chaperone function
MTMTWHVAVYEALVYSAAAGFALLAVASAVLVAIRQPARRVRVIEITLAALVALPLLPLVPGYPRLAVLPAARLVAEVEQSEPQPAPQPAIEDFVAVTPPTLSPPAPAIGEVSPGAASGAARPTPPAARHTSARPTWHLPRDYRFWIVVAHLAGTGAMIAWSVLGLAAVGRLLWTARTASDGCRAILREVAGPAGDRVALVVSPRASQPCALVWRRPTIVLPQGLAEGGDQRLLRFALAHEWSHVARGDIWSWSLAGVVRIGYFYQPLLWHLRRQLRLCQDYLADAASAADSSEDYAEFLTSYSSRLKHPGLAAGLGIAGRPSELHRRIVMLLDHHRPLERAVPRRWNLVVVPLAVVLLAAVACVRAEPGDTKAGVKPQRHQQAGATPKPPAPGPVPEALVDLEVSNDPIVHQLTQQMVYYTDRMNQARSAAARPETVGYIHDLQRKKIRVEEMIDERKAQLRPKVIELLAAARAAGKSSPSVSPYLQVLQTPSTPPFNGRIRPGDILGIWLAGGFPEGGLDQATVEPEGTLPLGPLYGRVHVAGQTLSEAQEAVRKSLSEILKEPAIQLTYVGHDSGVIAADGAAGAQPPRPAAVEWRFEPGAPLPPPFEPPLETPKEETLQPLDTVEILIPIKDGVYRKVVDGKVGQEEAGNMPQFNGTYVIEPDGQIALPNGYGRVAVKGLDPRRAGTAIRDRLTEKMFTRTALPTVHVVKRGRAVFVDGQEPPADYRVRKGDSLLLGPPSQAGTFNNVVDADGNVTYNGKIQVEGMTLAEAEDAIRRHLNDDFRKRLGTTEDYVFAGYVTIGGWREQADPEVIDRLEAADQPRMQRLERELQEIKELIRAR